MGNPLILNPDFQRGHVWTEEQQIAYVEYMLKGGTTGKEIYFNCSSWMDGFDTPIFCVDGLQRLTAAIKFVNNQLPVFDGHLHNDIEGACRTTFSFHVMKVRSKKELLKVYIDFNSGGTPHRPEEIIRIQEMIDNTSPTETL